MLELLKVLGVDPQLLFWSFLGSVCSIWFGPKNFFMALGGVMVGSVFGTGFAVYAAKAAGLPPTAMALFIGFVGMILGRTLQAFATRWRPPTSGGSPPLPTTQEKPT